MDITVKDNVVQLGWGYRHTEMSFRDALRGANEEALLRQCFLALVTEWTVVPVPEIDSPGRGPQVLGEENLIAG